MNRRQSMAVEPEELDGMWFTGGHKKTVQPAPQDLEERFKEATDVIDSKLNKFAESLEFMIKLMDERLTSFEARLPPSPVQPAKPAATKAKRHDTPLFSHPP